MWLSTLTHLLTPEHEHNPNHTEVGHNYRLLELLYMTTEAARQPDGIFSSFTGISKSELAEGKH